MGYVQKSLISIQRVDKKWSNEIFCAIGWNEDRISIFSSLQTRTRELDNTRNISLIQSANIAEKICFVRNNSMTILVPPQRIILEI